MDNKQEENETNLNIVEDSTKIIELNNLAVDNIFEDKVENAIEILKKCECLLESVAMNDDNKLDKKLVIIVLHNLACCYQKTKDFESCISYLEAVLYHFDGKLEKKYNIKITEEEFIERNDKSKENINLGDYILELRFSSKFHLQMCAALSQANQHKEALHHAKLAAVICEDNIIQTYHLFITKRNEIHNSFFEDRLKEIENVITLLHKKVISDRSNTNNPNGNYYQLREKDIDELLNKGEAKLSIRNILGVKKKDDWIHMLNIGNIMFLSALTNEDLDLDSDPKFELMRDAILEKVNNQY